MLNVELENIKDVLEEARNNKLTVFVKDIYIAIPEQLEEGKVVNYINGVLEASTITTLNGELALFFYQEDIANTKQRYTEDELEKKCKQEATALFQSLKNDGYKVIKGLVKP